MIWIHLKTIFSFHTYHLLTFTSRKQRVFFAIYLFLLTTLIFYLFTGAYVNRNLPIFLKNFPQITIEKGVLTQPKYPVFAPVPGSSFRLAFDASRITPPSVEELLQTNTVMMLQQNTLYVPGSAGMQTTPLPPTLNVVTSQKFLKEQQPFIALMLRFMAFITSLVLIPFIFIFDFCLAGAVGLFLNLLRQNRAPRAHVLTWAFFMLGPLTALWIVRLWVQIPFFALAQLILCIIYMQQIFNTLPEEK